MTYLVDNTELAVGLRTSISDVVNVEARIRIKSRSVNQVKHITSVVLGVLVRIRQDGKLSLGRGESSVFLEILVITTVLVCPAKSVHGCLVEIKQLVPVLDERHDDSLLLKSTVTKEGIIDGYTTKLVVLIISGCDEGVGDVRNIVACIRLAGDVSCGTLEIESVDKVAPETNELEAKLYFVGNVRLALAVAHAHGLFDPDNVGANDVSTSKAALLGITYRLVQLYELATGARVPCCHKKGPFSVKRPLRELHPGPPFNLNS